MEYKIYSQTGILKATLDPGSSTHVHEVKNDNVLNLDFTLYDYVSLDVNDYIDIDTERFTLLESYKPIIKNKKQYEYNVKFYGPESIAKKAQFVDENFEPITSYLDTPTAQLQYIVNCINRVVGTNRYSVGAVISSSAISVEYQSGSSCWDALNSLADALETEWWLDGTSFNLTKCEYGIAVELGYGKGLLNPDKEINESNDFFTRLIPLGSNKNIIESTYGHTRLQLPSGAKYVDQNTDEYGIVEKVVENAFSDIYPRFTGTVGTVRTETRTIESIERTIYFFTDSSMTFNPNDYNVAGLIKHIVFKSGDLNSKDFEANWYPSTGEWEIINQYPDEDTQLPGNYIIPRTGDSYTIYNLKMPTEYITAAENEFLEAVNTYLANHAIDFNTYKGSTDHVYLEQNNISLTLGRRVKLLSEEYFPSGSRDSRITKITRKLSDLNQMDIEISNVISKSSYSDLKNDVSILKTRVSEYYANEITQIIKSFSVSDPTDENVLSSLRVLKEIKNRALSRIDEDSASSLLHLLGGATFGQFIPGLTGTGAKIGEDGAAEMRSLKLWEFLEVPELRYNRITVNIGDKWNAPGGGIIKEVDTVNKIITLKLEDGEIGAVAENDICKGIFHSSNLAENATLNIDDSKGNTTFAGFATCYFRVVEILDTAKNSRFSYELRPVSDNYLVQYNPSAFMNFVGYANFTNTDRQTSNYETRTYKRYLRNMNTWEISQANIAAQFGDLSNLSIHGLNMTGYSAYLNNIYMSGTIQQFTLQEPLRMELNSDIGWLIAPGEQMTVSANVFKGWVNVNSSAASWLWTRDSGDSVEDIAWNNAHANLTTSGVITYDDLPVDRCLFTVTATFIEGTEVVTATNTFTI